jgi:hypothetical protein
LRFAGWVTEHLLSIVKTLGKMVGSLLLYLVGFDIVGVIVCLFFDILSLGDSDTAVYYALWFVLGVFCGLFSYDTGGSIASPKSSADGTDEQATNQEWTDREDSGKYGLLVILVTLVVLGALSVIFYRLWWQGSMEPTGFAPDSGPLTLTFFGAILASSIFAHKSFRTAPKKIS